MQKVKHIRISLQVRNFISNKWFWVFGPSFPQTCISRLKEKKNKSRHWIHYTLISLRNKFHLKQTTLSFWTKFAKKVYLRSRKIKIKVTMPNLFSYQISFKTDKFLDHICPRKVENVLFLVKSFQFPIFFHSLTMNFKN